MNRFRYVAFAVLLAGVSQASAAKIVFTTQVVTAECKPWQKAVTAKIPFKVEGDGVFELKDIGTGCDCTTATADAPSYKPGESGVLNVRFEPGSRVGFQRKTLTLRSKTGDEAVAFFQTTVPPTLKVTPGVLVWSRKAVGDGKVFDIQVHENLPEVKNLTVFSNGGYLKTEVITVVPGRNFRVNVYWTGEAPADPVKIVIKSDHADDDGSLHAVWATVK